MAAASTGDAKEHLSELLLKALRAVAPAHDNAAIVLERPKSPGHGDYSCAVALQLARSLKRAPREIATQLAAALPASPFVEKAEVAGAGFINLFLKPSFKQQAVNRILAAGAGYGTSLFGRRRKVLVEFVSANPTGPLHVGHGRGAAYGASLANLLDAAGFDVSREYYVNDAGRQMDILALSVWMRYLEFGGNQHCLSANAYQGDYVRDMARQLHAQAGARFVHAAAAMLEGVPSGADAEAHLDGLIASAEAILGADYASMHGFVLDRTTR